MTTVHIEDSTPEGRWLLDLIKDHKSVTIEPKKQEASILMRGTKLSQKVLYRPMRFSTN